MALRGEGNVMIQELSHEHQHQRVLGVETVVEDTFDQIMKLLSSSLWYNYSIIQLLTLLSGWLASV